MSLVSILRQRPDPQPASASLAWLLEGASIEVMPRTAAKIDDFTAILPKGTRVYIAHIDGTEIDDMVATAARLRRDGFEPMPHFPARSIPDKATLNDWIARYQGEADVRQGLILAGSIAAPRGEFHSSMQILETGLFGDAGFERLHVAGHPESNRDIDPSGGDHNVMQALRWKQAFSETSDAKMALATQFLFDATSAITWSEKLRAEGVTLPIHLGVAGPAKLQTLIKFAIACGVGPSIAVLQKRAKDVTKLLKPVDPAPFLTEIAAHLAQEPNSLIEAVHIFPLGGINASADWLAEHRKEG